MLNNFTPSWETSGSGIRTPWPWGCTSPNLGNGPPSWSSSSEQRKSCGPIRLSRCGRHPWTPSETRAGSSCTRDCAGRIWATTWWPGAPAAGCSPSTTGHGSRLNGGRMSPTGPPPTGDSVRRSWPGGSSSTAPSPCRWQAGHRSARRSKSCAAWRTFCRSSSPGLRGGDNRVLLVVLDGHRYGPPHHDLLPHVAPVGRVGEGRFLGREPQLRVEPRPEAGVRQAAPPGRVSHEGSHGRGKRGRGR